MPGPGNMWAPLCNAVGCDVELILHILSAFPHLVTLDVTKVLVALSPQFSFFRHITSTAGMSITPGQTSTHSPTHILTLLPHITPPKSHTPILL
ncbi:hypothetical protein Pelo_6473 [Pelomyxa schiedti]|nr:hypothetical protein Pelo_6473 [Pelomyxa schiedti]